MNQTFFQTKFINLPHETGSGISRPLPVKQPTERTLIS